MKMRLALWNFYLPTLRELSCIDPIRPALSTRSIIGTTWVSIPTTLATIIDVIDVVFTDIEAFITNSSNSSSCSIVYAFDVVKIGAFVHYTVNSSSWSIVNVADVVYIGASVNNHFDFAIIINIVNVVNIFLGLFLSFNKELFGT